MPRTDRRKGVASDRRSDRVRGLFSRHGAALAALAILLALGLGSGCGDDDGAPPAQRTFPEVDWERTEAREDCDDFTRTRLPFFGELHVHTAYSADAAIAGTLALPRDAYRFAKGEPLGMPPFDADGGSQRVARLGRPLDFAAVTDHAESFGAGTDATLGQCIRNGMIVDASECDASEVWMDTQAAAEEHYDRSAACSFTTFVGYEWSLRGRRPPSTLHRNVIFRNAEVPPLAITSDEITTPENLWAKLGADCRDAPGACDVITIPHNPNLSSGVMFQPITLSGEPFTPEMAGLRASFEPIVEMMQAKGDSECRPGVDTNDELCGFEKINRTGGAFRDFDPNQEFRRLSFVRNALKDGLLHQARLGTNPFAFGFIGATDNHTAAPGSVREPDYPVAGTTGIPDSTPQLLLAISPPGGVELNGGGLAVLWAEENSRDALFAAMRRREVYATSGPRHIVRFFAGNYADDLCEHPDLVEQGYRQGVPMGGNLAAADIEGNLRFLVQAMSDPGTSEFPGAPLQRIQIVKGWLDRDGTLRESVYDVAGDPNNGASADPMTCEIEGSGFAALCAVWTDPDFDSGELAFYYARVLENPTCRWHSFVCNDLGVRCDQPDTVPEEFASCCDPLFPRTIQERSWTSPIFFTPESAAAAATQ